MADIDNLKRQHEEITALMHKLSSYKDDESVKRDAFTVSMTLAQLSGKIGIHLSTEDKFVYPQLFVHDNERIRQTSKKFAEEMGSIASAFTAYKNKYNSALRISENPTSFRRETAAIQTALSKRIDAENSSLYPLLV